MWEANSSSTPAAKSFVHLHTHRMSIGNGWTIESNNQNGSAADSVLWLFARAHEKFYTTSLPAGPKRSSLLRSVLTSVLTMMRTCSGEYSRDLIPHET